jgi:hypothetical protein
MKALKKRKDSIMMMIADYIAYDLGHIFLTKGRLASPCSTELTT